MPIRAFIVRRDISQNSFLFKTNINNHTKQKVRETKKELEEWEV